MPVGEDTEVGLTSSLPLCILLTLSFVSNCLEIKQLLVENELLFFHTGRENMPIQVKCLGSPGFLIALYSIFIFRQKLRKFRLFIIFSVGVIHRTLASVSLEGGWDMT